MARDYADQFESLFERVFSAPSELRGTALPDVQVLRSSVDKMVDAIEKELNRGILYRAARFIVKTAGVVVLIPTAPALIPLIFLASRSKGGSVSAPKKRKKVNINVVFDINTLGVKKFAMNGSTPIDASGTPTVTIEISVPNAWRGRPLTPKQRIVLRAGILNTLAHEVGHVQLMGDQRSEMTKRVQQMHQAYFRMPMEFDANVLAVSAVLTDLDDKTMTLTKLMKMRGADYTAQQILQTYSYEPYKSEFAKRVSQKLKRKVTW